MTDAHNSSGSSPDVGDILSLNVGNLKFSWIIIESKHDRWTVVDYGGIDLLGGSEGFIYKRSGSTYHDGRISPGELIKLRLNNKISGEAFSKIMERL